MKQLPTGQQGTEKQAGTNCTPRLSLACCIRVISVITVPASTAKTKECRLMPNSK